MDRKRLEHCITRLQYRVDGMQIKHGDISKCNYHAGYNLGYWEWRLGLYRELLDEQVTETKGKLK